MSVSQHNVSHVAQAQRLQSLWKTLTRFRRNHANVPEHRGRGHILTRYAWGISYQRHHRRNRGWAGMHLSFLALLWIPKQIFTFCFPSTNRGDQRTDYTRLNGMNVYFRKSLWLWSCLTKLTPFLFTRVTHVCFWKEISDTEKALQLTRQSVHGVGVNQWSNYYWPCRPCS